MKLTIIGANGAVPRAGGACSSYLVEDAGTRLLLDCGSGAYAQLQKHTDPFTLDGVVISHVHADHFFDLVPFRYALTYALRGQPERLLPLYVPPGGGAMLDAFARSWGSPAGFFEGVFEVREYDPSSTLQVGGLQVSFVPVPHYVDSRGIRVEGSATLAYSGDTAMDEALFTLAAGADLFLCEATAQESTYDLVRDGHMSAADAARVAVRAGVGRLVLTHIWYELDPAVSLREAQGVFDGPVDVAVEGKTFEIGAASR